MPARRTFFSKPFATVLGTVLPVLAAAVLLVQLASCFAPDEPAAGNAAEETVGETAEGTTRPPRHLVLISLDTFRADHLDSVLTPRLAALAEESVRFDDFVTAAPSTLASHTSLFTGLYPHRHGVASNGWMVPGSLEMLAEVLRGAGFHNVGLAGSFALLDRFRIDQGFDHWNQEFDQTVGVDAVDQSQRRADRVVDAALAYLDGHVGDNAAGYDGRLFLFVHLFDTHYPYEPPASILEAPIPSPPLRWTERERARAQKVDGEPVGELARRYAGEAAFVDAQVGRLVDDLAHRGLLDDALLVVTTDHGEALWQHGERWHATEVYDTTVHGLFFARLPSRGRDGGFGARVRGAVGTVDVMPTVLRALGLPAPGGLDGEAFDLRASAEIGAERQRLTRQRFAQATGSHVEVPEEVAEVSDEPWARWPNYPLPRTIRQGRWKLIQWPLDDREALFDLETDPGERQNLIDAPPADSDIEALRQSLETWARSADPLPSHFDRDFELDTRRQLCALGYVECPDEE